jgi:UDP-N-acetylmuramoyl-L-alanyl-D-glutamate--2,6-diaminopimelate ligase
MKLAELLENTPVKSVRGPDDRAVHALRYDSRRVEAGDVFFAWRGAKTDGHDFIADVSGRGACAIVLEDPRFSAPGPTFIEVADARRAMATMSADFYGRPDRALRLAGVTGTNGKTTTAFILKHLLAEAGTPVGLIGTVRYEIGERILPAARTTPESLDLHHLLAQMKAAGCGSVVMEVSSSRAGSRRSISRSGFSPTSRRTISIITVRWRSISKPNNSSSPISTARKSRASR